uniref:Reverse transcriptase domain-containing protein n=1 Tax=Photinus pyralis TaxID=7054 RepID=A0A1Y1M4P4_PHOPY
MILVKRDVECYSIPLTEKISVEIDCEISGVFMKNSNIIILSVYRSPLGNFKVFIDTLTVFSKLNIYKNIVILCGDFNVKFHTSDNQAIYLTDWLSSYGLYPTIFKNTRNQNCLDNIFVNFDAGLNFNASVFDANISDHLAQTIYFATQSIKHKNNLKICRPITTVGKSIMYSMLENMDWSFVDDICLPAEEKFKYFLNIFNDIFLFSFPTKALKESRLSSPMTNWFDDRLRNMRETLRLLNDNYKMFKNEETRNLASTYRKFYKKELSKAKIRANDNFIKNSNSKPKAMWKVIKQNSHESCGGTTNLTSDEFNDFFVNIADEISASLPSQNKDPVSYFSNYAITSISFDFNEISFNNVRDIVNAINNSSCKDYFDLTASIIKSMLNVILIPLTKVINACIRESTYPIQLKVSRVVPLHKGGDQDVLSNYRPLSVTPVFSKIFEKALKNQIADYFETNKLFSISQHGFREQKSTSTAILQLTNTIITCFEANDFCVANFLDLTKAFDCVNHEILLNKLAIYKFTGKSIALLKSYLSTRTQYVHFNNKKSAYQQINTGVPQGSVLGPILFLIYINDMPFLTQSDNVILYADDTTLLSRCHELKDDNQFIENIEEWLLNNRLKINQTKTEKRIFTLRHSHNAENSTQIKFLGVTLDQKLNWTAHCSQVAVKLSKACYLLRCLKSVVSRDVVITAYYGYFHSIMCYAIITWGHASGVKRIFSIQRRAIRIVTDLDYRTCCKHKFIELGILTIPCIYILNCILHVATNLSTYRLRNLSYEYDTRNKNNIRSNQLRLNTSKNCSHYYGIQFYNKLPQSYRSLSVKELKKTVTSYLKLNAFYSSHEFLSSRF